MKPETFSGIYQILHTPFDESGEIDWESLERQIEYCVQAEVHGLVIPAMASEFFSLSDQERFTLVEAALHAISGRVPVLIGVQAVSEPVAKGFAEHAAKHGADGLMAMPPYLRKAGKADLEAYYLTLAQVGLPVMIQNAPALSGAALSAAEVAGLLNLHPNISYIKEEAPPILQRISQVIEKSGDACKGVFGGANGIYLIDELDRGAVGNMPAGGFVDVQVKAYNLYAQGNRQAAMDLHNRMLPLLNYASTYGVSLHKFLLWRRGVLRTRYVRDPQRSNLDSHDEKALYEYWQLIADETMAAYPLT
jgi:4-hydroxy-tetrahydrodipicolinate synthase